MSNLRVKRLNNKDCGARTGNVVALYEGGAQVHWILEESGSIITNSSRGFGVRTKVRLKDLQKLVMPVDVDTYRKEWEANRKF